MACVPPAGLATSVDRLTARGRRLVGTKRRVTDAREAAPAEESKPEGGAEPTGGWRVCFTRRDLPRPAAPMPFVADLPPDLDSWLDVATDQPPDRPAVILVRYVRFDSSAGSQ